MLCSDMKLQRRPYADLKFRTLLGKINSDTQGGQCLIKTHKTDPGWLAVLFRAQLPAGRVITSLLPTAVKSSPIPVACGEVSSRTRGRKPFYQHLATLHTATLTPELERWQPTANTELLQMFSIFSSSSADQMFMNYSAGNTRSAVNCALTRPYVSQIEFLHLSLLLSDDICHVSAGTRTLPAPFTFHFQIL